MGKECQGDDQIIKSTLGFCKDFGIFKMKPLNILDRVIRSGFLFKIIGLDTVLRMNSKEERVERLGDHFRRLSK